MNHNRTLKSYIKTSLRVMRLYKELDQKITAFKCKSQLSCLPGCGHCCENPSIETSELDFFPLANHLWKENPAEAQNLLEKIQENPTKKICHFYEPAELPGKGRCSIYPFRPLICRLFGFSARREKNTQTQFHGCKLIREKQSAEFKQTQLKINAGLKIPINSDYASKLWSIDPKRTQLLPINQAIIKALETFGFLKQLLLLKNPRPSTSSKNHYTTQVA